MSLQRDELAARATAARAALLSLCDALSAPSPAATPAAWVPSVGDVVIGLFGEDVPPLARVDSTSPLRWSMWKGGAWHPDYGFSLTSYARVATPAERAAAGLPVDETPAFDEAREREAARVACKWVIPADAKMFTEGWLARARVAAKGGARG